MSQMRQIACSWPQAADSVFRRPHGSEGTKQGCEITLELPTGGTISLRLVSSARTCEIYSLGPGGEWSYACSLRGSPVHTAQAVTTAADTGSSRGSTPTSAGGDSTTPLPPLQQLWAMEHRWARPPQAGRAALLLRLLSLADRNLLHLDSLELITEDAVGSSGAGSAAGGAASTAAASSACDQPAGAGTGAAVTADAMVGGGPGAEQGGSQMDEVRAMLSQLAAEDRSGGQPGAAHNHKRALMAAIARSVLQQQPPAAAAQPAAPGAAGALPLLPDQQQQQQQQQQQRQQQQEGWLEQGPPQQQPGEEPDATAAALQRLEGRVAALEALCREMHGMLRQCCATLAAGEPAATG